MCLADKVRQARRDARLSLPALAERVGIPDSELAAYEEGSLKPDTELFDWIVSCARLDRGRELEALLDLAEQLPASHTDHTDDLEYPVFGR